MSVVHPAVHVVHPTSTSQPLIALSCVAVATGPSCSETQPCISSDPSDPSMHSCTFMRSLPPTNLPVPRFAFSLRSFFLLFLTSFLRSFLLFFFLLIIFQYAKMLRSMQGYAVIATGVRLAVSCSSGKAGGGGRNNVLNTQGTGKLGDNVSSVFGSKFLGTLTPVSVEYREGALTGVPSTVDGEGETADAPSDAEPASAPASATATIAGYVSKCGLGVGRSDSDRQFWYINGRPVDLPRFTKVLDDAPLSRHAGIKPTTNALTH